MGMDDQKRESNTVNQQLAMVRIHRRPQVLRHQLIFSTNCILLIAFIF